MKVRIPVCDQAGYAPVGIPHPSPLPGERRRFHRRGADFLAGVVVFGAADQMVPSAGHGLFHRLGGGGERSGATSSNMHRIRSRIDGIKPP